nr:MAG TPA: hypothetical protein [Caudoviricetes sp.]
MRHIRKALSVKAFAIQPFFCFVSEMLAKITLK